MSGPVTALRILPLQWGIWRVTLDRPLSSTIRLPVYRGAPIGPTPPYASRQIGAQGPWSARSVAVVVRMSRRGRHPGRALARAAASAIPPVQDGA